MSRAIIGTASSFQDNVADVTEGLTQQITSAVAAESIPTLTSEIRRTLSGSHTRPSAGNGPLPLNGTASPQPNQTPVAPAGQSVVPQSTQPQQSNHHFQQYMDFLINHQRNAGVAEDIDPAGVSQSFSEIADIAIRRGFFDAPDSNPDNDPDFEIQHRDVRVNALLENLANRGYHAEPVLGPNNGIQEYRVSSGGGNRIPPVDPPDDPRPETLDEGARRRAAETAEIVESITGGSGGGNRIPPVDPPDNPPDPPDDDNPDDHNLFQRLTEWLQTHMGVRPDNRQVDSLLNNLGSILGGQPAQPNDPTRPTPLAGFMDAVSNYFGTSQLSPEAQIRAEQDLTEAVEELTQAVTGNTRTRSGTTPRANRVTNWIRRRAQRAVVGSAKILARMARPLARGFNRLIPQNMRAQMTQMGAQIIGQQARNLGVPAATAARFGATLGPAAALVGGAMLAVPIVGAIVRGISATLNKWSAEALVTINRVAKYSPQLTTAQMGLDAARLQRDINTARRSGPMGALRVDMQNREEAAWENWEQFKTDSGNAFGAAKSRLSALTGEATMQAMALLPRAVELLGNLTSLQSIEAFGKEAVDYWTKSAQAGIDPYVGSSFGVWMNNQPVGAGARDQLRRARRPLGPQP
jgi:hypothetical protein